MELCEKEPHIFPPNGGKCLLCDMELVISSGDAVFVGGAENLAWLPELPAHESTKAVRWAEAYAARSKVTLEWLRSHGRDVRECHCGAPECEGWQMVNVKLYEEEQAWRGRH